MLVSRAFFYLTFSVPSKRDLLQVPLTELLYREMFRYQVLLQQVSPRTANPFPAFPAGAPQKEMPVP